MTAAPTIQPIPTRYGGYHFRSRLEARWAVAFTALGVKWEYEPEGFDLSGPWFSGNYLPDFWLSTVKMWAEVKPEAFTEAEFLKCFQLAKATGHPCLMLNGTPRHENFWAAAPDSGWYVNLWSTCKPLPGGSEEFLQGEVMDYNVFDLKDGRRFYVNTGIEPGSELPLPHWSTGPWWIVNAPDPVVAARSARFEHGESGAT